MLLLLLGVSVYCGAQVLPAEGARLNFRLVGFSFPAADRGKCKIEIADGSFTSIDSFASHIIKSAPCKSGKVVTEVPAFDRPYTWRAVYGDKSKSPLYHFATMYNEHADTAKLRLRILHPAEKPVRDYYVSVDAGGVLYDMNGEPVWFIPDTNGIGGYVGCLKFTPQNTVTFIRNNDAYEINFRGDLLWKAPNTGSISGNSNKSELYHHELTRLSNGHYMVLGAQVLLCKQVVEKDTSYVLVKKEGRDLGDYKLGRFGTITEYDKQGNVVWNLMTSKFIVGSDFDYATSLDSNVRFDPHDNSFIFEEDKKWLYVSFRNTNTIMKIEYPTGRVLANYGENFKTGKTRGDVFFCNPHAVMRSSEGYLYFFNNNSCRVTDSLPTVVMFQEPTEKDGGIRKVWEYQCSMEGDYNKKFLSGGNARELPDGSMFICMGSNYSKIFIVTRDKKLLWSALPEAWLPSDRKWQQNHQFRANIITREQLERLIWSAEMTN
jgi:hypothetical protein